MNQILAGIFGTVLDQIPEALDADGAGEVDDVAFRGGLIGDRTCDHRRRGAAMPPDWMTWRKVSVLVPEPLT